jgi:hypothetical protein
MQSGERLNCTVACLSRLSVGLPVLTVAYNNGQTAHRINGLKTSRGCPAITPMRFLYTVDGK